MTDRSLATALGASHHRQSGGGCFEHGNAEAFFQRRMDQHIRVAQKLIDVITKSDELDMVSHTQLCRLLLQGRFHWSFTKQQQRKLRMRAANGGHCLQHEAVPFSFNKLGENYGDNSVISQIEFSQPLITIDPLFKCATIDSTSDRHYSIGID